jgi:hypothetical protein
MNTAELAKAVVYELLSGGSVWLFLLITALFAGAGAYFGKYLSIKGANLATKEDFNTLQEQLHASTRLVESVKTEIARTDWAAREWKALRIKKIEELMTILNECEEYFDALRVASIAGQHHPDTPPFEKASIVSELYLPELRGLVGRFVMKSREVVIAMLKVVEQDIATNRINTNNLWDGFFNGSLYSEMYSLTKQIQTAASQLLKDIVLDR